MRSHETCPSSSPRTRWMSRATVILFVVVCAVIPSTRPDAAGAGTVADDAHTAMRGIIFPLVGSVSYSNEFGACRGNGCSRSHEGNDLFAPKLREVVSPVDGYVAYMKDSATPDGRNANYIAIRDAEGWTYFATHINNDSPGTDDGANPAQWRFAPGITAGARVFAGQHIAFNGDSGNAEPTPAHVHFEIRKPDGTVINPYQSLRASLRLTAPYKTPNPPRNEIGAGATHSR